MPAQCPTCKALNRDTATFCDHCGTRLIGATAPDAPRVPSMPSAGPPADLPEEAPSSALPGAVAPPPGAVSVGPPARPAPPGRPDMLPEEVPGPGASPASASLSLGGPTAQPPHVDAGRPPRYPNVFPWSILVGAVAGVVFYLAVATYPRANDTMMMSAVFAVFGLLIGVPIQMWLSRAAAKGIVTHMRMWMPTPTGLMREGAVQNWVFDLCLTDDKWRSLVDSRGFQLPIVEVAFRSDRVHGAPIEEGSQVVLKGRWRKDRIEVKDLWNLTPVAEVPTYGGLTVFWGRVSDPSASSASDLRYPGEKTLVVWSFRLALTDPTFEQLQRDTQGNMLAPWPVEIRAASISGPMNKGDKVEVHGRVVRGTVYAKVVRNHSAGGASLVVKEWVGIPS